MYTLGQNIANQTNCFNSLSNRRLIPDSVVAHYADLLERDILAYSEALWLKEITEEDECDDYYGNIYRAILDYNNLSLIPNGDTLFALHINGIISQEEYIELVSLSCMTVDEESLELEFYDDDFFEDVMNWEDVFPTFREPMGCYGEE